MGREDSDVGQVRRRVDGFQVIGQPREGHHVALALREEVIDSKYTKGLWRVAYWSPAAALRWSSSKRARYIVKRRVAARIPMPRPVLVKSALSGYCLAMGSLNKSTLLIFGVLFIAVPLGGSNVQPTPDLSTTPASGPTGTSSSTVNSADVLARQQSNLTTNIRGAVVQSTSSGTGGKVFSIPAVPPGKKRIGFSINCTGDSSWRVSLKQKTPTQADAPCSLTNIASVDFPINSPTAQNEIRLELDATTTYWITIYYI